MELTFALYSHAKHGVKSVQLGISNTLMSAQARNYYYKKVCIFDHFGVFMVRIFLYSVRIQENTDRK